MNCRKQYAWCSLRGKLAEVKLFKAFLCSRCCRNKHPITPYCRLSWELDGIYVGVSVLCRPLSVVKVSWRQAEFKAALYYFKLPIILSGTHILLNGLSHQKHRKQKKVYVLILDSAFTQAIPSRYATCNEPLLIIVIFVTYCRLYQFWLWCEGLHTTTRVTGKYN